MGIKVLRANQFLTQNEYENYIAYLILTGWNKRFQQSTNDSETSYAIFESET